MLETIELDRCESHGVWFDFGELDRLKSTADLQEDGPSRGVAAPQPKAQVSIGGLRRAAEFLERSLQRAPSSLELKIRLATVLVSLAERLGGDRVARELARRALELLEPLDGAATLGWARGAALRRARSILSE